MKKFMIILTLLIAVFGASAYLFFKPKNLQNNEVVLDTELTPLPCDLNKEHSCEVEYKGKKVSFALSPKPIYTMQPVTVKIEGLSDIKNPSLEISGVNMDMGVIKAKLEPRENGYVSNVVLSSCLLTVMRYRFEIYSNGKKIGLFIDFDLRQ
ncbi:hypothetical protein CCAL13119_00015 [Campylobacter sp. RM13119]|uniref:hypothetical protein n=1 Tax=Campylobacter TaxID=194 RepID=UPI00147360E5|nr:MULTISPECIES: hypothetical protein [unclassified Campylobacter]MBE3022592.1 hypothetical protein [Campylobacter sp. 7477a]MBE3605343.1 hypothetical protein [Campylobacter sp. RM13119]MBE3608999.1 hypothetical protein [Campylobacter sp. RM12916]